MMTRIAVIGGSGLYEIDGVRVLDTLEVSTPFGAPSDRIAVADIGGERVAFLPRHGRGHRLLPSEVPSRANIWALKSIGVEQIVSVSAVGSLAEEYAPGHVRAARPAHRPHHATADAPSSATAWSVT